MTHSRAIMLQGTGSDVGKSVLVAGLCRAFTRRGLTVRPFKPQNMSNNAAVTPDGGEIGRAQALQARACGVAPSVDMNPVLLKPQSDVGAQLVVRGKVSGNYQARDYHALRPTLMAPVMASFEALQREADIVVVEGAGGAAEVNLRDGDIANMGFAVEAGIPVVLVGDIERGGVIASLVGTVDLLEPDERALLVGFIVNKFRGDLSLFDEGVRIIEEKTTLPCIGVVPYLEEAALLPPEDSMNLPGRETVNEAADKSGTIHIAVPKLLHIANFDDLDPLVAEPDVRLTLVDPGTTLPGDADVIILPGTKTTLAAMRHFREQGWDIDLAAHRRRGGHVLGLCGGYQMLGNTISDPDGIEGQLGQEVGLGLLEIDTVISGKKTLVETVGVCVSNDASVRGYEMHMGVSKGEDTARPYLSFGERSDGATSPDGLVSGCYLHGLFTSDAFRSAFLGTIRRGAGNGINFDAMVETALDQIADRLETVLDVDALYAASAYADMRMMA
jgi:adenosylcobyric acid synthase